MNPEPAETVSETDFQKRIEHLTRATNIARQVLGVGAGASREDLRSAWRRSCKEHHPDRSDQQGSEAFRIAKSAYLCLSEGDEKECEKLLDLVNEDDARDIGGDQAADNRWGYFLSWREQYF